MIEFIKKLFKSKPKKIILHGHDLNEWDYLGMLDIFSKSDLDKVRHTHPVFFFCHKKDTRIRSFYVKGNYIRKHHNFIQKRIKPWCAGQDELYFMSYFKGFSPSSFLREYMIIKHGAEWSVEENWWKPIDQSKYKKESLLQNTKSQKVDSSNIIEVDFEKK